MIPQNNNHRNQETSVYIKKTSEFLECKSVIDDYSITTNR